MAYAIVCEGGPKKRQLCVGHSMQPLQILDGRAFYVPNENSFILAPVYPFNSAKDARAVMKKAREIRCQMFLPYDGYGICKIIEEPRS